MKFVTDEMLSAFLDQALEPAEMQRIREAVAQDEALADRLAEFALLDEQVKRHAQQGDQLKTPEALVTSLQGSQAPTAPTILRPWKASLAIAASVAVTLLLVVNMSGRAPTGDTWQQMLTHISSSPSGVEYQLSDGDTFINQFSFLGDNGQLCRVYRVFGEQAMEGIACYREGLGWQEIIRIGVVGTTEGDYALASGPAKIQHAMRELGAGSALTLAGEAKELDKISK